MWYSRVAFATKTTLKAACLCYLHSSYQTIKTQLAKKKPWISLVQITSNMLRLSSTSLFKIANYILIVLFWKNTRNIYKHISISHSRKSYSFTAARLMLKNGSIVHLKPCLGQQRGVANIRQSLYVLVRGLKTMLHPRSPKTIKRIGFHQRLLF